MRHRARHVSDLVRDLADLLGYRQQELGAEAVGGEGDSVRRRLRFWRGWRGLRPRSIGDRTQRLDHLRALVVVLQRLERAPGLLRRQHIGVVGGRNGRLACFLGRLLGRGVLRKGGEGKQRAGEQDRWEQSVRHEGPF